VGNIFTQGKSKIGDRLDLPKTQRRLTPI
jgi:hypothetical protein